VWNVAPELPESESIVSQQVDESARMVIMQMSRENIIYLRDVQAAQKAAYYRRVASVAAVNQNTMDGDAAPK
jgi:hypothetical protein